MPRYYQTVCKSVEHACDAYHKTDDVFNHIEELKSYGRKRYRESILWRFDNDNPVFELMLAALFDSGLFIKIDEIPEEYFWRTGSNPV